MAESGSVLDARHIKALTRAKRLARTITSVHAVDYGLAYVDRQMTDRASIRFHTNQKIPLMDLPQDQRLPDTIEDVEVDVVVAGYMLHDGNPRVAQDILQPGLSIGNLKTKTTGTLGLVVQDPATGATFALSNWHVLCGGPEAAVGDDISQPGPFDLGSNPARPVARLERWLRLSEQYDAALARLLPGMKFSERLFGIAAQPSAVDAPALGQRVFKIGAVSGGTRGIVDGIAGSYRLDYTGFGDGPEWMEGFRIVPDPAAPSKKLSLEGDSGSLWMESAENKIVGLHFAGEDGGGPLNEVALAHPMQDILERFAVTMATQVILPG
jgi:hypothetical protein